MLQDIASNLVFVGEVLCTICISLLGQNCMKVSNIIQDKVHQFLLRKKENDGVSLAWLHHKNHPLGKHHYEYWQCGFDSGRRSLIMPFVYNLEALCDYLGACKTYDNIKSDEDVYKAELKFWREIGHKNSVAMHEVNKMFIDRCLEELVSNKRLNKKKAQKIYDVCLNEYKLKE